MAENLDDGEFWLPPQFLSDDDGDDSTTVPFSSKPKPSSLFNNGEDPLLFPSEFPYGFACSDLSSPIDSLPASSETESDEDEQLFAELTRCLSRSSLHVDSKASENNNNLGRFVSGSPQSTLCGDCKCRKGSSSQGSPNGVCQIASSNSTLNLLHAAADEVETLRLNQQTVPQRNSSPVTLPSNNNNNTVSPNDLSFFAPPSLSHYQLQIAQLQRMRQQHIAKTQNTIWGGLQKQNGGVFQQRSAVVDGRNNNNNNNVAGLGLSSSAWPTLQNAQQQQIQNPQPYMRAVFLGNGYGSSTGTGVFLPRPVESRNSTKKQPACTTAYVPARVAHALNLKLEDYIVGCQPQQQHLHRFNSTSNVDNVAAGLHRQRGNNVNSQKKRSNNTSRPQPAAVTVSNEIKLPQEWTY